jgi:hypothetical protein
VSFIPHIEVYASGKQEYCWYTSLSKLKPILTQKKYPYMMLKQGQNCSLGSRDAAQDNHQFYRYQVLQVGRSDNRVVFGVEPNRGTALRVG